MKFKKCDFCEYDRGPLVEQPKQCVSCEDYINFQVKFNMSPRMMCEYGKFMHDEECKALATYAKRNVIKFILNGCDISFIAEAPADITLEQLLKQCDKIKPDWCACGICSYEKVYDNDHPVEIEIGYDWVRKVDDDASCRIMEEE